MRRGKPRNDEVQLGGRKSKDSEFPLVDTAKFSPSFLPLTAESGGAILPLLEELSREAQGMEQFMKCGLRTNDFSEVGWICSRINQ